MCDASSRPTDAANAAEFDSIFTHPGTVDIEDMSAFPLKNADTPTLLDTQQDFLTFLDNQPVVDTFPGRSTDHIQFSGSSNQAYTYDHHDSDIFSGPLRFID